MISEGSVLPANNHKKNNDPMNTTLLWMCPLSVFCLGCLSAGEKGDAVSSLNAPASLPVPSLSVRLAADGESWLTADRLKEARDLILEGKQMKKPFFMDREVPCLRDAYLLSAPEDEHVVIFLQYRKNAYAWTSGDKEMTETKPVPGKGLRVTSGNGVLVETFGMQDEAGSVEVAFGWVSLFLPMRDRAECVRGTKMNEGVSYCALNGKDPLFNRANAEAIVRYVFSRNPLPMMHGSLYGSLPYYPIDGTPYAVYLLPKGQFAPIEKPEDVAGLDFCYAGLPNGRGATSVGWKGESMNWYGWYPSQYMLDMSGEAFLALLCKVERDEKEDESAATVSSGQLSSMPPKTSNGATNQVVADEGGRIDLRSVKDARLRILAHKESRKPGAEGKEVPYWPSCWDMYLVSDPDDADRPVIFLRSPYQSEGRADQGIRLSVGEDGDVLAETVGFKVADELASALPGMAMFLCSPRAATVSEDAGMIVYLFTRSTGFGILPCCASTPPWVRRIGTCFLRRGSRCLPTV